MNVKIPYGEREIEIKVPEENLLQIIDPVSVEKRDERTLIENSLKKPINSISFSDFIKDGKVLIVVNDANRPTPTNKVLDIIYKKIKDEEVGFIVATGSHREPTDNEIKKIFGEKILREFYDRIFIHNAKKSSLEFLGKTSKGTEFYINKKVMDFEKLVNINSVEPHYFAGYTGGRKSFIPGISGYKTIEQNHRHALEAEAKTCKLKGNPVHEDIMEAIQFLENIKKVFSINLVLDGKNRIHNVKSGNLRDSFYKAVKSCKEIFCVKIKEKADIVITIAQKPLDINLYQAQKAMENGKLALKENGTLILVAECKEGIGPSEFYDLLKKSDIPEEILNEIQRDYVLGYHKAAKIIDLATWSNICAITDLDDRVIKDCFISPFKDLQKAIDSALEKKGKKAKIIILKNGGLTVPLIE